MFNNIISQMDLNNSYQFLYPYQQVTVNNFESMLEQSVDKFNGKIILPTGAGKTRIMEHMSGVIISKYNSSCVFGISCHRILLSNNLIERNIKSLVNNFKTNKLKIYICHSGDDRSIEEVCKDINITYDKNHVKSVNQCDRIGLKNEIEQNKVSGYHSLFIILYHSMENVIDIDINFDFCFHDEAHIACQNQFYQKISNINSKINIYFTATPCTKDSGNDMYNIEVFGEEITNVTPFELVIGKYITPIKAVLSYIKTNNNSDINDKKLTSKQLNTQQLVYLIK